LSDPWRIIKSEASNAAFNMALDEVFLTLSAKYETSPTFRIYSWDTPALSLGYAQKSADVNLPELDQRGWQLVRRPTGGRAILHTDELTYSITAPADDPLVAGSLLDSYQRISQILQKGLDRLGVSTAADKEYGDNENQTKANPVCFRVPSNFEITCNGKKLIGSAQARKFGGVLQHGSLPLFGDLTRITQVLNYSSENDRQLACQKLLEHATILEAAAGKFLSFEEVSLALIDAFSINRGVEIILSEPTEREIRLAGELVQTKYGTDDWNFRI